MGGRARSVAHQATGRRAKSLLMTINHYKKGIWEHWLHGFGVISSVCGWATAATFQ